MIQITQAIQVSENKEDYGNMRKLGMKKGFFVFGLMLAFNFNQVNASNLYEPIGGGDSLEEYNIKQDNPYLSPRVEARAAAITDVNNYIITNKLAPAKVSYQYSKLSKITSAYRYMLYDTSNYRPKGVVIHATAGGSNDNIVNEISYMSRNWANAFVHSFADYKEIIEVHNAEYAAWGAGPKANPYYIHIELVETGNTQRFIQSVNNQAYYTALKLRQFNLKPSRANKNKSGTVWFHSEVTKYLGGTDHSDPTGYFKKHNYSFAKFYELVQYHYNKLSNDYKTTKANTYYSNKKAKTISTSVYYKNKLVERATTYYNSKGIKNKYIYKVYALNGKIKANKEYTYAIKSGSTVYNNRSFVTMYNTSGKRTKASIYYKNKLSKIVQRKLYTYHSNTKMKNRTITKYRQLTKTYYRISHENASWSSTGKKTSCNRYDYNSRGQLKSNKYGKARYVKYYYKSGRLNKRLIKYYNGYGKLNKKIYYKYYR